MDIDECKKCFIASCKYSICPVDNFPARLHLELLQCCDSHILTTITYTTFINLSFECQRYVLPFLKNAHIYLYYLLEHNSQGFGLFFSILDSNTYHHILCKCIETSNITALKAYPWIYKENTTYGVDRQLLTIALCGKNYILAKYILSKGYKIENFTHSLLNYFKDDEKAILFCIAAGVDPNINIDKKQPQSFLSYQLKRNRHKVVQAIISFPGYIVPSNLLNKISW